MCLTSILKISASLCAYYYTRLKQLKSKHKLQKLEKVYKIGPRWKDDNKYISILTVWPQRIMGKERRKRIRLFFKCFCLIACSLSYSLLPRDAEKSPEDNTARTALQYLPYLQNPWVWKTFILKFCQPKPNFVDFQFSVRFHYDVYIGHMVTSQQQIKVLTPCDISTLQRWFIWAIPGVLNFVSWQYI